MAGENRREELRTLFHDRVSRGECALCGARLPFASRAQLDRLCPRCVPLNSHGAKTISALLRMRSAEPIQLPMDAKNSYWLMRYVLGGSYALVPELSRYHASHRGAAP